MKQIFERDLLEQFGPLMGGNELQRALGFKSSVTFRRDARLGRLPVEVFEVEGRRGKFALTSDVARWLYRVSGKSDEEITNE